MIEKLESLYNRYNEINDLLMSPDVSKDIKQMTALSKEQRGLEGVVKKYLEYRQALNDVEDLKEMLEDPELKSQASEELIQAREHIQILEEEIKVLLIPKDPNDEKNCIIEIRGAAGGDEGNIFAGDLFRMYTKYAETKGFKIDVMESQSCEQGGYSYISFMVKGDNAYGFLKYESGAHRVQRVPITESAGRIQTSTATVLVMPETEDVEIELNPDDVRIDTFCASGPGGQCVNTTKSAIRLTHIPTGIVVSCQDRKSQHENKAAAFIVLRARLFDFYEQQKQEKEGAERISKIGHGDRSEKIRTYNYPQNRVTDHRIGFTLQQLDRVMEGKLEPVIQALIEADQKKAMSVEEE